MTTQGLEVLKAGVLHTSLSDHSLTYVILNQKSPKAKAIFKKVRTYKHFNADNFKADITKLPLARCGRLNDVDTAVLLWTELYLKVLNKHAPERMIKVRARPKPWFTPELQDMINKKDQLRKIAVQSKCQRALENFKVEKKAVGMAVNNA